MYIDGSKSRPLESSRHFRLTIHSLFPQDGNSWSRVHVYIRSRDILINIETKLHIQSWIIVLQNFVVLFLSTFGIVSNTLQLVTGGGPDSLQINSSTRINDLRFTANGNNSGVVGVTNNLETTIQTLRCCEFPNCIKTIIANLDNRAWLLSK